MKAYILTQEYNQYDQYGAYFLAWFPRKPNTKEIKKSLEGVGENESDDTIQHIHDGGGRRNFEDVWYYLEEVESVIKSDIEDAEDNLSHAWEYAQIQLCEEAVTEAAIELDDWWTNHGKEYGELKHKKS